MIDAIIFDCEGVVVDTESIWDKGQEVFLSRRGFVYDRERVKPLLTGRTLAEGVEILKQTYNFGGDTESLARERADIVRDIFARDVEFIEGFLEFYSSIHNRFKTCIATAMEKSLLDLVNLRLGLSALFDDRIYSLVDVGYVSKPNPDIFLYAAKQLKSSPRDCLVIEDSPYGIDAAKRAGMACVAIATTYAKNRLKAADFVVDSYSEMDLETWIRTVQAHSLP